MIKIYLLFVFTLHFISSFIKFSAENYTDGIIECIIFTIAAFLIINQFNPNWFISIVSFIYILGGLILISKSKPKQTLIRLLIGIIGFILIYKK